ncbi:uncharacterized protein LOC124144578 [Haliotis rufescens]|uniref:uncharacterized protein LOC124144578 n=1 Tax=Haliotis rufescens TaxID=6454 RepID=UPI001EAFB5B6|nr:uncharacterized protein LOC124144578 [Haliotis rufescens]
MESAKKWLTSTCVLVLAVCLFIQKGLAIECFICNSYLHGDDCRNLPEEKQYMYKQRCDFLEGNKTYTVCRKMVQELPDEVRIIRQCGSMGKPGCIARSGTRGVRIRYCHCGESLCNMGPAVIPHLPTYLTIAIATFVIPRIYQKLRE